MAKNKISLDIGKGHVTWTSIPYGLYLYMYHHPNEPQPLGVVIVRVHNTSVTGKSVNTYAEVLISHVISWARRLGIRTRINEEIMKAWPTIVSSGATKDGKKFMEASGYKEDQLLGWVKKLKKPVVKKKNKKGKK